MVESFFIIDGQLYKPLNDVTVGSALGDNAFMCHFKNICLEIYLPLFKLVVYRSFIDDKVLLFNSKDHVEKFKNHHNKQDKNTNYVENDSQ